MASHVKKTGRQFALPPLLALVLALGGCAGQMAYRDGNTLMAQDQVEAGLLKYQEALKAEPTNAEYRAAYVQARDRAAQGFIRAAERQLADGQPELAEQGWRRALALDPANERARAGLRTLERNARQAKLLAIAREHVARGEYDLAKQRLNALLTETPSNEPARQLLREVTEKTAPSAVETGLAKAYKQPITIEFRDAPLKQVFEVISRRSNLNFVFDKDVKTDQRTTVLLRNSTVEAAIYFLLLTNQLEQQVMDANTVLIYPNTAAKQKEYQEMTVKTFYLANADAKMVANTLKTILKTRDVVVDEKLNLLIVRDNPEAIRLAERVIATQDMPEAEVMLEVEILEVKRSTLMNLGVQWPTSIGINPLTDLAGDLTVNELRNLNSDRILLSGISGAININKTDTDSNLLANPRIRVRNKQKANIVIGDKLPVVTPTVSGGVGGFASESVTYVDVGLKLAVEPTIYLNDEIAIKVELEVSNLVSTLTTKNGSTAYQLGTRQASTTLQLKDGENQVLAGLINNEQRGTGNKIPGAGDLPILGRLFGTQRDDNQKTEIVLSITPRLIRNVQRPEASASEFSAGTDASFRRRPDLSARPAVQMPALPGAQPRPGVGAVVELAPPAQTAPVTLSPSQPSGPSPQQLQQQQFQQMQQQQQLQQQQQPPQSGQPAEQAAPPAEPAPPATPAPAAPVEESPIPSVPPPVQDVPLSRGQPAPLPPASGQPRPLQ
ncbi:UNVERIFIED_ORG: general secretion pathway protein D [Zoogloea ramigera]|uniref:Secretin N-terminal domain-containing protein n=1 Tax=Duganella zoogloeoides TaxID=75659 RepID=A0ABZ0XVF2_9BURK|nr:secretin N-terminal domain-containing protein [Duganella zoogloeoides]WQH03227.1 secretin N-terminal domain-containing protein [Duganella zoogloeoides]